MFDLRSIINVIFRLKRYDTYIDIQSRELESLKVQEDDLKSENQQLIANVDKMNDKLIELKIVSTNSALSVYS